MARETKSPATMDHERITLRLRRSALPPCPGTLPRRAFLRAGLTGHTFATRLRMQGRADISSIATLLGHTSMRLSERYARGQRAPPRARGRARRNRFGCAK